MTPLLRKYSFVLFLPATTSTPSRALRLELKSIKYSVRFSGLGAKVPGHHQEQLSQTLIVCLYKMCLLCCIKFGGPFTTLSSAMSLFPRDDRILAEVRYDQLRHKRSRNASLMSRQIRWKTWDLWYVRGGYKGMPKACSVCNAYYAFINCLHRMCSLIWNDSLPPLFKSFLT